MDQLNTMLLQYTKAYGTPNPNSMDFTKFIMRAYAIERILGDSREHEGLDDVVGVVLFAMAIAEQTAAAPTVH